MSEGPSQPWLCVGQFTTPKRDDSPNEDRWAMSPDGAIVALSDGASVSFDPAPWAELLARKFAKQPTVSEEWLRAALQQYATGYDRDQMEWMQQGAFDRGSFATLLGVALGAQSIRVFAMGDTTLAMVEGGHLTRTIPYTTAKQFLLAPTLLSTSAAELPGVSEAIPLSWSEYPAAPDCILLMMTDALAQWLLQADTPARVEVLLGISTEEAFGDLVQAERANNRMRRDDTTLLVLRRG